MISAFVRNSSISIPNAFASEASVVNENMMFEIIKYYRILPCGEKPLLVEGKGGLTYTICVFWVYSLTSVLDWTIQPI
jgi:hypothetical protein